MNNVVRLQASLASAVGAMLVASAVVLAARLLGDAALPVALIGIVVFTVVFVLDMLTHSEAPK